MITRAPIMIEKEDVGSVNDLEHLLSTILVPSFPPNRSQWKKLEIALKFINKSKESASMQSREKNLQKIEIIIKISEKCQKVLTII